MSQFEDLVEDYARQPVPAELTVSGLRIALIIVGVAITLPAFLTGATLGQQLGLHLSAWSFVTGGLVVAVVGAMTGSVGARTGLPTALLVSTAFGTRGAYLVNTALLAAFLGWFGVTVALFAQAAGQAIIAMGGEPVSPLALMLGGSLAMIAVTVFGFKALDRLSLLAVPLMAAFLFLLVFRTLSSQQSDMLITQPPTDDSVGLAASAVAGAFMVGATMMPDLCRYARSAGHAVMASVLAFGIGYPVVLMLAAIPAVVTGQTDMLNIVFKVGLGISGFLMIVFATLTTNANNLYSSSLVLSALVPRISKWKLVIGAGLFGCLFATMGIMERLVDFLILLGIVIPPIAGIISADHWLTSRATNHNQDKPTLAFSIPAIGSWILACCVGFATTLTNWQLSGLPAVDSIATAILFFLGFRMLTTPERARTL